MSVEKKQGLLGDSLGMVLKGVERIGGDNSERCRRLLCDNLTLFKQAPGSRHNHQAWRGGYLDHIAETFKLAEYFLQYEPQRERPFSASDVYLVMFLHNIEKPFAYTFAEDDSIITRPELSEKPAKKALREELIAKYGFTLSDDHQNALRYVEGIPSNEYKSGARIMSELAGFCHVLDTFSARVDHNYPEH